MRRVTRLTARLFQALPGGNSGKPAVASDHWPGNVRELQNTVERAIILWWEGLLAFDLPSAQANQNSGAREADSAGRSPYARGIEAARTRSHHYDKAEDDMIEILTDFPDNIIAAAAHGVVTKRDYQDVLIPRVELALKRHPKIRCYYDLGRNSPGWKPARCGRISKSGSNISRDGSAWPSSRSRVDQASGQCLPLPDARRGPSLCHFRSGGRPRMDAADAYVTGALVVAAAPRLIHIAPGETPRFSNGALPALARWYHTANNALHPTGPA